MPHTHTLSMPWRLDGSLNILKENSWKFRRYSIFRLCAMMFCISDCLNLRTSKMLSSHVSCLQSCFPPCGYPPGTCEDDEDARGKRRDLNMTGFKVTSARGTGQCNCSRPFYGQGCELGFCPPGQRLDRHVSMTSNKKYEQWQVCVPCESGRFKNFSGNSDECSLCPPGQIPQNSTHCVPCPSGNIRSPDHPEKCVPCATGDVALAGAPRCTECQAGTAPNEDGSECVACPAGGYAKSTVCNKFFNHWWFLCSNFLVVYHNHIIVITPQRHPDAILRNISL